MPLVTANPLVVQHEGSIFVLGGVVLGVAQSSAAEYSIDGDTWKRLRGLNQVSIGLEESITLDKSTVYLDMLMVSAHYL